MGKIWYIGLATPAGDHLFLARVYENELVGGIPTPLKNMNLSVGMMTFPIYGKS